MNINLDKRQKIILVILILLVIFLIWQIMGLSSSRKKTTSIKPETKVAVAPKPPTLPNEAAPPVIIKAPIITQPQLIPPQQAEYLQAVDQYQLAQIKRMLAEQLAATAAADASIAKSKAETTHLLTGGNRNAITTFLPEGQAIEPSLQPSLQTTTASTNAISTYQVSFIGNKEGKWSAILAHRGEYTIVNIGTVLADQTLVADINNSGVTLKNGETTTFLSFQNNLVG